MPDTPAAPARVAFLGPLGTYSHAAAMELFANGADWQPVAGIADVFSVVEAGEADWGVVPVENSSEGSVLPTLDSFVLSPLQIAAELMLPIRHCLIASGATASRGEGAIERIVSHQHSLGQCRHWLREHFPGIEQTPVSSNAEAARLAAASEGVAAIAGAAAARLYGLEVLHQSIEDTHDNTTRFLQIGQHVRTRPTGRDKTSIIILAHNEPGTLFQALEPFHRYGISLTKLESRPSRKEAWSYFFYMDFEGHLEDSDVGSALQELEKLAIEVKVLGSYPGALAKP